MFPCTDKWTKTTFPVTVTRRHSRSTVHHVETELNLYFQSYLCHLIINTDANPVENDKNNKGIDFIFPETAFLK